MKEIYTSMEYLQSISCCWTNYV